MVTTLGRSTVYNNITTPELLQQVLPSNVELADDFIDYLKSIGRAETTIEQYKSDLRIFWVWNLQHNQNKEFIKITKREFARFQNHCLNEWGWSPKRIRRVKSVLSSMSNYIENILDEEPEFEGYRAVVRKIESPADDVVREKSIFTTEELQGLLDYLVEHEEYEKACMLSLAMNSGRRKAELPRFKVNYFTDENVRFGSLYKTPEKVRTKGRGKGKYLELYVMKKPFDPYLRLWLDERQRLGIESEWLFPLKSNPAEPLKPETLDSWAETFSRILQKPFYFHSLRHYFTSECLKNNLPASVVQEIIGWESADMVNLYDDRDADETLAKYFDENGIKQVETKNLGDI